MKGILKILYTLETEIFFEHFEDSGDLKIWKILEYLGDLRDFKKSLKNCETWDI